LAWPGAHSGRPLGQIIVCTRVRNNRTDHGFGRQSTFIGVDIAIRHRLAHRTRRLAILTQVNDSSGSAVINSAYLEFLPLEAVVIRTLIVSFILGGSIAVLPTPQANAQSPDPALLAPGQSGRMLAPPRYTDPSPSYTSPRPGGTPPLMRGRHGQHLSHPRLHNHGL
jgi:hypothetical protein